MKLVYLTSKYYPQTTADHFFVLEMARAFTQILGENFLLVVRNNQSSELENIPHYSFGANIERGKLLYYFFRLPFFILGKKFSGRDTVFFTNDIKLLKTLFFWKKFLHFKYRVVSDWHMLFGGENEADIIQKSDGLITTTKHLKNLMAGRFGVPESKILAAYGGVDLDLFEKITESTETLRTRLNLPNHAFLIGYVGFYKTMGMSKGVDIMMRSLAFISDDSVKMVFVGGRPQEIEEYKKTAKEIGVSERVVFVPVVSPETVALHEKAMDALCIPYPDKPHFREYGFPMKAYEYLAAKKPIIFSDLPIIGEVLGDCAISFTPDDAKALAKKLEEIKNNPERTKELMERAYQKAQGCTWKARAGKIIAFAETI
jgi:glycosyltransferase involved in cell wall biosynthesis